MKIIMDKGTDKEITEVCETMDILYGNEPFLKIKGSDIQILDRNGNIILDITEVSDDKLINLFMRTGKSPIFQDNKDPDGTPVWEIIHHDK